nr:MAG TPA: hypothetical protein [Caudoviricetes sp.]
MTITQYFPRLVKRPPPAVRPACGVTGRVFSHGFQVLSESPAPIF